MAALVVRPSCSRVWLQPGRSEIARDICRDVRSYFCNGPQWPGCSPAVRRSRPFLISKCERVQKYVLALQKVLIPECERVHRARVHRARTRSRRTKEVRTGVATALPAHRHARARFPAPCARAHASTAHSARAQHACARLAGDAHALTRQHTLARQKLDVMLEALATGWPSAGWRLAHLARARCANASPPPLLARPMRHPHALPAIHHRCCHRVLRDDDDERDGDERDDAEDREHDGRRATTRRRSGPPMTTRGGKRAALRSASVRRQPWRQARPPTVKRAAAVAL